MSTKRVPVENLVYNALRGFDVEGIKEDLDFLTLHPTDFKDETEKLKFLNKIAQHVFDLSMKLDGILTKRHF